MGDRKIIDILPPQKKEPVKIREEGPKAKISLPQAPSPKIKIPKFFLGLVFLAVIGIWAYFSFGEARIEIWPKLEPLTLETKIIVDKSAQSVDALQKIVPGFLFEENTNLSGEFSATGKKPLEKKAEGVIRVYNNSSLAQTLVANTRFQPPLEKFEKPLSGEANPWFRLKARIVVPPKSFQDAAVVADSPGEEYNIKPSKFSIPGLAGSSQYTLVFGESFQQFAGGEKRDFPQIVSQDLENAQDSIFQKAKTEGERILREKVPQDYLFLADAAKTELLNGSSPAKAGEQLEKFSYEVSVKSSVLTSSYEDLINLIKNLLSSRLPNEKEMDEASLKTDYSLFSIEKNLGKMTFSTQSSINTFSPVNETALKNELLGRSLREAKMVLEGKEDLQKIKIHLWPFWLRSVPKNIEKVKIELRLDPTLDS